VKIWKRVFDVKEISAPLHHILLCRIGSRHI
jgi:hypothetical protein